MEFSQKHAKGEPASFWLSMVFIRVLESGP